MMFKNSVVLVTGANRGLGEKLTSALVSAGASKVYAACRTPNTLSFNRPVVPVELDVTVTALFVEMQPPYTRR